MSRKFGGGRGRSSGAGLQFDKLLKACSNSKKPCLTKTGGSIGRFGITNFTSTRNISQTISQTDTTKVEESRFKLTLKRPRVEEVAQVPVYSNFSSDFISSNQNVLHDPPPPPIFKPRKFFKSRNNPEEDSKQEMLYSAPQPIVPPPQNDLKIKKSSPKKSPNKVKEEVKAFHNNTNTNSTINSSPSIKLRIFKDKKTSKFVSVSDTPTENESNRIYLEPNLSLVQETSPKKRGRPKIRQDEEVRPKLVKIKKLSENQNGESRVNSSSGRITRNSTKAQVEEMPTLQRLDYSHHTNTDKIDSAEKLVERLQEEDSEFRQLTEMLSSMEDESSQRTHNDPDLLTNNMQSKNELDITSRSSPSPPHSYSSRSSSPINYSNHIPTSTISEKIEENVKDSKSLEILSNEPESERDICSILGEEWDESFEEGSPKRLSSPHKVTRFEMEPLNSPPPEPQIQFEEWGESEKINLTIKTSPLNSSYSVRNLITIPPAREESLECEKIENLTIAKDLSPVKSSSLAPSPKKGSIFKSRAVTSTQSSVAPNPKKRLALYRHKFGQESESDSVPKTEPQVPEGTVYEEEYFEEESLNLHRAQKTELDSDGNEIGGGKVYCSTGSKRLFTVIRNVKAIHELQESGEVHEFDGDILYILEDLKESNPLSSRCLSAISLAMRCMEPAFRMHLRAHGTVAEFCRELHDAPTIPVLALAAATVLFVLSQDRLNMDLDTESLQLILALAKSEEKIQLLDEHPELSKHKQRIIDLVMEMKKRGHAKHIRIDKITASELALETLLFLTSKRAGEWVKKELRTLGGLEFIVRELQRCLHSLEDIGEESFVELLWKMDRCLKVLQQVSFNHEENQKYLLQGQGSPEVFINLFKFLSEELGRKREGEVGTVLREVLFSVLRVLVNLTHDYRGIVYGSELLASNEEFLELTLNSIFKLSNAIPDGKSFDLLMHSLCMLLNLVEHSKRNRICVLGMTVKDGEIEKGMIDALVELFFTKELEAQKEEASTDDILTSNADPKEKEGGGSSSSQNLEKEGGKESESSSVQDIIDRLIETAGKHMENSMIAAHISLLIAYIIMDDPVTTKHVQSSMPNSKFLPLMILLKKLFNFMSITTSTSGSTRGLKATTVALKFFEKCDPESAKELKEAIPD